MCTIFDVLSHFMLFFCRKFFTQFRCDICFVAIYELLRGENSAKNCARGEKWLISGMRSSYSTLLINSLCKIQQNLLALQFEDLLKIIWGNHQNSPESPMCWNTAEWNDGHLARKPFLWWWSWTRMHSTDNLFRYGFLGHHTSGLMGRLFWSDLPSIRPHS